MRMFGTCDKLCYLTAEQGAAFASQILLRLSRLCDPQYLQLARSHCNPDPGRAPAQLLAKHTQRSRATRYHQSALHCTVECRRLLFHRSRNLRHRGIAVKCSGQVYCSLAVYTVQQRQAHSKILEIQKKTHWQGLQGLSRLAGCA